MDKRHFDLNKPLEEFDRPPSPKLRAEKGRMRAGAESSGHSPAMQAINELSKRALSPDRENITRADLQNIIESTQEPTEQNNTGQKRKASSKTKSERMKEQWKDPEHREKMSEMSKKLWENPEHREKMSEKMSKMSKKLWENPEHREKMSEKMSETSKKLWENPEYREKMSEKMSETSKKLWENPEYREKMSEMSKKLWENPGYREKMSEKMSETSKKLWENPEHREKISEKMSEMSKKLWENPEHREKINEINAKREDEKLTKKYGEGSRKEAAKRLKALKKAWQAGTLPDAPD